MVRQTSFGIDQPSPAGSNSSHSFKEITGTAPNTSILCEKPETNISRSRKRTFSHKVRSGCDTCKTRHIKCDETRPVCLRCRKARFSCHYNVPKTWIFDANESSPSAASDDTSIVLRQNNDISQAEDVYSVLEDIWCTPEERRSISYWVANTGPWLGNYAGKDARHTWEVILPRCARQLSATKHLIVAVAMLDERLSNPSTSTLEHRSQRILNHYNAAIKTLVSGKAAQLDILLSSMIAWVLEIMNDDPQTAKMHLDASGRLLRKAIAYSPQNGTSEEHDIIHHHITIAHQQCVGYAKTEPQQDEQEPEASSVFPTLVARHNPQSITSLSQIKEVIKEYYNQLSLAQDKGIDIAQARRYRRSYEIALLKYRHVASEPAPNIIAVHYWLNLANNLLPRTDDAEISSYHDVSGMDYILDQTEDLFKTKGLSPTHREDLDETLNLMLINVIRFAKHEKDLKRARNLMRMLDQGG